MAIKASELAEVLPRLPSHKQVDGPYYRVAVRRPDRLHLHLDHGQPVKRYSEGLYEFRKATDGSDWILVGWPEDE